MSSWHYPVFLGVPESCTSVVLVNSVITYSVSVDNLFPSLMSPTSLPFPPQSQSLINFWPNILLTILKGFATYLGKVGLENPQKCYMYVQKINGGKGRNRWSTNGPKWDSSN